MHADFTLLVIYAYIIKLVNPRPGLNEATHKVFPLLRGGLSVPRQRMCCSHLLRRTCNHSGGKRGGSEDVKPDHRRDPAVWEKDVGRDKTSGRTRWKS